MNQAIMAGFLASFISGGIGTAAGATSIFVFRQLSAKMEDILLSIAAGIMLAATFFSLLLRITSYNVCYTKLLRVYYRGLSHCKPSPSSLVSR